jgi:hypothetical protein
MEVVEHVKLSIANAENHASKISKDIVDYTGYTGTKTRHFYNNICSIPNCKYLEIGTWYGSSSISAMYNNNISATFIDNWSQFNGNRRILEDALIKYHGNSEYDIIESDCWKVDTAKLPEYNVYLYDGGHEYAEQYNAIKYYYNNLSKNCIVMVDDWNWEKVRNGTLDAFRDLNVKLLFKHEIFVDDTSRMPNHPGKHTWWNGIGIFVLNKD